MKVNKATGTGTPARLNWGAVTIDCGGTFGLALPSTVDLSVGGTLGVSIGNGFVAASGTFELVSQTVSGTGGGVTLSSAQAIRLTVTNASLWVGVGGSLDADHHTVHNGTIGFGISGVGLTLGSIKTATNSYTGLELTFASATISGVPGVDLAVTGGFVRVNKVQTGTTKLDWAGFTPGGPLWAEFPLLRSIQAGRLARPAFVRLSDPFWPLRSWKPLAIRRMPLLELEGFAYP